MVKDQEHVSELVAALRGERDRLSRLMEDLLHYGRPASVEMSPLPLEGVLQAALARCGSMAASHVDLRRSGDVDGARVRMNAQRLEEVFSNLLENACQHSPPRAQVWIEVSRHADGRGHWVRCRIRDAGPGFQDLSRVFEPFYTRRKGGTGLGLAIVQRIVLEHGGTVRAENHTAGGAAVVVDLPIA
jgi:signal transduction histidine kinase